MEDSKHGDKDFTKEKKEKSLRSSFLDGIYASCMGGFVDAYLTPFILLLGATAKHIGMLSALPNFFASIIQLKSADITEKVKSRKKIITKFVLIQALSLLPMAFMAICGIRKPFIFILFVVLYASFGAISYPPWASLMADHIEGNKRGSYFGWRNRTLGFIAVLATFTAGLILHVMKKHNAYFGFALLFSSAFIFRMISWCFLGKMHEPYMEYKKEDYFTFFDFISRLRESNFAKFVIFVAMMNFSVNMASPFFSVFMLRELNFSYLLYTSITVTATITIILLTRRWGRHADNVGNMKIIKLTSRMIGFIPLLWIINHKPAFLFLAQMFSGFAWAGFGLCTSNFIYDAVTPAKRTRCIAYFNLLNGLALCAGALLGGFILKRLPFLFGYKILSLFLISSLLRIIVSMTMPAKLKEVRSVNKINSNKLFFSVIGIRPLLGMEKRTPRY